jgi:hypothetical protein
MQDTLEMRGELEIILTREDGTQQRGVHKNLIVQTGHNFVASAILAAQTPAFGYFGIGTGTTAPAAGDTQLQTQVARLAFTNSSASANVVSISTTFPAGTGTGAITEAGLFTASSGGTMFSRTTFAAYNKGAGDSLTINWTITA